MATIDAALERYLTLLRPIDKANRMPVLHRSSVFGTYTNTIFSHYPAEVSCAFSPTLSASYAEHKAVSSPTDAIQTEIVGGDFLSIKRLLPGLSVTVSQIRNCTVDPRLFRMHTCTVRAIDTHQRGTCT